MLLFPQQKVVVSAELRKANAQVSHEIAESKRMEVEREEYILLQKFWQMELRVQSVEG